MQTENCNETPNTSNPETAKLELALINEIKSKEELLNAIEIQYNDWEREIERAEKEIDAFQKQFNQIVEVQNQEMIEKLRIQYIDLEKKVTEFEKHQTTNNSNTDKDLEKQKNITKEMDKLISQLVQIKEKSMDEKVRQMKQKLIDQHM